MTEVALFYDIDTCLKGVSELGRQIRDLRYL